jgi:hypothetical protein
MASRIFASKAEYPIMKTKTRKDEGNITIYYRFVIKKYIANNPQLLEL